MASQKKFQDIPLFPSDLPVVDMSVIPLQGLLALDPTTVAELATVSKDLGFFLIDLRGHDIGEKLINDIDRLFDVSKDLFDLPDDIKTKYAVIPKKGLNG